MPIRLTPTGVEHTPEAPHNFAAWGGIKELLLAKDGAATREEILAVLEYCRRGDDKHRSNTAYLGYALRQGWLAED